MEHFMFAEDNISERELTLFKNKGLFAVVKLGIKQARNGQVKSLGSFSKYAQEEITEQIALDPRVRGDDTK